VCVCVCVCERERERERERDIVYVCNNKGIEREAERDCVYLGDVVRERLYTLNAKKGEER